MSEERPGVHVPSKAELDAAVVPDRKENDEDAGEPATTAREEHRDEGGRGETKLSADTVAALRHFTDPANRRLPIGAHYRAIGITSGSRMMAITRELIRLGMIRVERKGRSKLVHPYNKAYEFLGLPPPKGEGVGGTTHKAIVAEVARTFRESGLDARIEHEIGPDRKRVDLVGFGPEAIVGVEVGISDVRQEIINIRNDLAAGVLTHLLFITTDRSILRRVRRAAMEDPEIAPHIGLVRFYLFDEGRADE